MKRWILVVALLAACGGKKEEPKPEPKEDDDKGLLGSLKDKAKSIGEDVSKKAIEDKAKSIGGDFADKAKDMADKAKDVAGDMADKAKSGAKDLEAKASELGDDAKRKAEGLSKDAITAGKTLKDQVADQVKDLKIAGFNYDFAIDSSSESEQDHKDKLRGMKVLKVGDYSVGYEQVSKHPLGKVYNWQFRFTWRLVTGQVARLSIFTDEELPELELATLMGKLIPKADLLLKLK